MKRLTILLIVLTSLMLCACKQEATNELETKQAEMSVSENNIKETETVESEPDPMKHFYGEYVSLDTDSEDAMYILNYLVMDCCDEWNEVTKYADTIQDACAIEGFEFYCYDMSTNTVPTGKCMVTFHPTKEFLDKDYESITVYHFKTQKELPTTITENGEVQAEADGLDGIFLLTKKIKGTTNNNLWISNVLDCNNQCRSCSDDW